MKKTIFVVTIMLLIAALFAGVGHKIDNAYADVTAVNFINQTAIIDTITADPDTSHTLNLKGTPYKTLILQWICSAWEDTSILKGQVSIDGTNWIDMPADDASADPDTVVATGVGYMKFEDLQEWPYIRFVASGDTVSTFQLPVLLSPDED